MIFNATGGAQTVEHRHQHATARAEVAERA